MNQTIPRLAAENRLPLLFVGIVLLAGCAGPRSSSSARVQPLDESLRELKTEFNRDISKPRVLALFSPTCGGCLYGARALQHEVAAAGKMAADPQMLVVWLPMLDTDNEHEARKSARRFDFTGARHFYDAGKQTSARLMAEQFPNAVREALEVLPRDHPKRAQLEALGGLPPEKVPLWDAVLVFPPGARWDDRSPAPVWWTRQIGLNGEGRPEERTSLFWKNNPRQPAVESDWYLEAHEALGVAQRLSTAGK